MSVNILIIGSGDMNDRGYMTLLTRPPFNVDVFDSVDQLPTGFDIRLYRAIFIDLDRKIPPKTTLATWRKQNGTLKILGLSSKSFHPDLSEIIGQHLFACLKKPVDEEELIFLLKSSIDASDREVKD